MQVTPRVAAALGGGLLLLAGLIAVAAVAPWSSETVADSGIQGDTDCSGHVNAVDALWPLRQMADAPPVPECIEAGDVDCDSGINEGDVTAILRFSSTGEDVVPQDQSCPAIGQPLASESPGPTTAGVTPTKTADPETPTPVSSPTDSPVPTASECTGEGGGLNLPDDPGGSSTPNEDAYGLTSILSTAYLGDTAEPLIKYVPIPGQPNEALVVLQSGLIYRVALNDGFGPSRWGDVSQFLSYGGEEGLLSLVFSPDYESDCRLYLYYTTGADNPSVLARFTGSRAGLDEGSGEPLLTVTQPASNHNGGDIAFDAAGLLYLSLGDGGDQDDPDDRAQDLASRNGKVLRIDVSGESGYTIPPNNPFQDGQGGNFDDIFALGLRNPFRMSIDPVTDDIWLGDVGGGAWEEVNEVTIGGNYGWDCKEGDDDHDYTAGKCDGKTFIGPRAAYDHNDGQAITGGVIYRGEDLPELYGWYVYADFYSGWIWAVDTESNAVPVRLMDSGPNISAFTLLADGEIAVVTYDSGVFQLAD